MSLEPEVPAEQRREPDIDPNGVDRSQIRAMLALEPLDRLRRMQQFLNGLVRLKGP
jgi:hypothetical protein